MEKEKEIFEVVRPTIMVDLGVSDYKAEEVRALYFNKDALIETPYKLFRLDGKGGDRQYYEFNGRGNPRFYMSVTTFIKRALPTSYHLIKWIADMGETRAEEYKQERAAYGTFMHGTLEQLLINGKYNLNAMEGDLMSYIEKNEYSKLLVKKWLFDLKKDVLAFAQWMLDYNVKPIAVEIMLRSKKMGVAGAIDIVCQMDVEEKGEWGEVYASGARKGEPKETKKVVTVNALVDMKGGRKGFYESHELQLETYKRMFEENFPDVKIQKTFNWSGSEWRTKPSYKLKDQTNSPIIKKLNYFIKIAKIDWAKDERQLLLMEGLIDLKSENGLESNFRLTNMSDLVKVKMDKKSKKKKRIKKPATKKTPSSKMAVVGGGEDFAKKADEVVVVEKEVVVNKDSQTPFLLNGTAGEKEF